MLKQSLCSGALTDALSIMYATTKEGSDYYAKRYIKAIEEFGAIFKGQEGIRLFSAPGRTELCGNHTDHQRGRVLAASVTMDMIAVVRPNSQGVINVKSQGYEMEHINLKSLSPNTEEINTTSALIRGIAAKFVHMGYLLGGFDAYITSDVLQGSGLSSSAAFEVLIGTMINGLFCNNDISPIEIAQIGQYAENEYFKKPCGLMDQMACSVGGFVAIDFKDAKNPSVEKIAFDFAKNNTSLCIIDTGGSHADLTPDYAAIPLEMGSVASYFNKEVLSEITKEDIFSNMAPLRNKCGDRAVLRALHFFNDTKNALLAGDALKKNDFKLFESIITASGNSSYKLLQNL